MDDEFARSLAQRKGLLTRLIVALALILVLGYFGYLAITIGDFRTLSFADWQRGERRELEPADVRGSVLRNGDRVFVLTTQSERIVPLYTGIRRTRRLQQMLHVDLWAFEAKTATLVWKRRLRTYQDRGDLMHEILGVDGGTLWVMVREPLAIAVNDGAIAADGARLEALNPPLVGKRVDQAGYIAFGGQGLQLTLTDATQWVVHGDTLKAEPRDSAAKTVAGISVPAAYPRSTNNYQLRGLSFPERWLGVMTEREAAALIADPVIPDRDPKEPRGAMYDFLLSQHVPGMLTPQPQAYRLWSAHVKQVSAAPRDWPKELPDTWGTRDQFSNYAVLPDAPKFIQAGLLGDSDSKAGQALWFRDPDSVLVLHHNQLGPAGRLHLTRVAGPAGRVVWNAPLELVTLNAALWSTTDIVFFGTEPNPAHNPNQVSSSEEHYKVVAVDIPSGQVASYDLTAESVRNVE